MKTSNILFISFLIFLFGGIFFLFIGSKYYVEGILAVSSKKTATFSVVVAEPGAYLVLKNGRGFSVSQSYKKDRVPDFAPFEVRNDTLFVAAVKSRKDGEWFIVPEVYCKNVKSIVAKEKANVSLKNYQVDSLAINLNKANFYWDLNKPSFVKIVARNSYLNLKGKSIENLTLDLDKTESSLDLKNSIKTVTGNLKNNSKISFPLNGNTNLNIDKTSYASTK